MTRVILVLPFDRASILTCMAGHGKRRSVINTDGGLYIEMAMLKVVDDWRDGSGWTYRPL